VLEQEQATPLRKNDILSYTVALRATGLSRTPILPGAFKLKWRKREELIGQDEDGSQQEEGHGAIITTSYNLNKILIQDQPYTIAFKVSDHCYQHDMVPYEIEVRNLSGRLLGVDLAVEDSKSFLMQGFQRKKKDIRADEAFTFKLTLFPKFIGVLALPKVSFKFSGPVQREVHDSNLNRGIMVLPVEKKADIL